MNESNDLILCLIKYKLYIIKLSFPQCNYTYLRASTINISFVIHFSRKWIMFPFLSIEKYVLLSTAACTSTLLLITISMQIFLNVYRIHSHNVNVIVQKNIFQVRIETTPCKPNSKIPIGQLRKSKNIKFQT